MNQLINSATNNGLKSSEKQVKVINKCCHQFGWTVLTIAYYSLPLLTILSVSTDTLYTTRHDTDITGHCRL